MNFYKCVCVNLCKCACKSETTLTVILWRSDFGQTNTNKDNLLLLVFVCWTNSTTNPTTNSTTKANKSSLCATCNCCVSEDCVRFQFLDLFSLFVLLCVVTSSYWRPIDINLIAHTQFICCRLLTRQETLSTANERTMARFARCCLHRRPTPSR